MNKLIDPIKKELSTLANENKSLKTEMMVLKTNLKEESQKNDKIVKILKEHHNTMDRNDRESRSKRLLLGGVEEGQVEINETVCKNDDEKVNEIFSMINQTEGVPIHVVNSKRIGKKEENGRPRYILLEFQNSKDRNYMKNESENLKGNGYPFFLKADRKKLEREEYKRLYAIKEYDFKKTAELRQKVTMLTLDLCY